MSARKCNWTYNANYLKIKFENVLYILHEKENVAAFCIILGAKIKLSYCRPDLTRSRVHYIVINLL